MPTTEDTAQPSPTGLKSVIAGDHTTIGPLFIIASVIFGAAAAVVGVISAAERLDHTSFGDDLNALNDWFWSWSLYRIGIIFLVVMPLLLGIAMTLTPRLIGASRLAFPRAALGAFWAWLFGAVIVIVASLSGGGWDKLNGVTANENDAIALTLLGTGMVIFALLTGAIVVATTVIAHRPTGVSLLDAGPLAWSMMATAAVWMFTLPVFVANLVIVYADMRGRAPISYGTAGNGDIWRQLDWIFEAPAIYGLAIPALGIAAQILIPAAKAADNNSATAHPIEIAKRIGVPVAIGLFATLAFGGWSQDFFAGAEHRTQLLYVFDGIVIAVPMLAIFGLVTLCALAGRLNVSMFSTSAIAAAAAVKILVLTTIAGALRVIEPLELFDTRADTAIFSGVALAAIVAGIAAIWHWTPETFCSRAPQPVGAAAAVFMGSSAVLLIVAHMGAGFDGAVNMIAAGDGIDALDRAALAGSLLFAAAMALVLLSTLAVTVNGIRSSTATNNEGMSNDDATVGASA